MEKANKSSLMKKTKLQLTEIILKNDEVIKSMTDSYNKAIDEINMVTNNYNHLAEELENKNKELKEFVENSKQLLDNRKKYIDINEDLKKSLETAIGNIADKNLQLNLKDKAISEYIKRVNYLNNNNKILENLYRKRINEFYIATACVIVSIVGLLISILI